jgi:hypothetical protein
MRAAAGRQTDDGLYDGFETIASTAAIQQTVGGPQFGTQDAFVVSNTALLTRGTT